MKILGNSATPGVNPKLRSLSLTQHISDHSKGIKIMNIYYDKIVNFIICIIRKNICRKNSLFKHLLINLFVIQKYNVICVNIALYKIVHF